MIGVKTVHVLPSKVWIQFAGQSQSLLLIEEGAMADTFQNRQITFCSRARDESTTNTAVFLLQRDFILSLNLETCVDRNRAPK